MRPRGANGECGIAPTYRKTEAAQNLRAPLALECMYTRGAWERAPLSLPVAWEMMGVSDPRTFTLFMAPVSSDW
ncbi:hypothetical protein N7493_000800 [Penicillium malachiteum]|uniref:Uncharacterized protein n=1 Tax=Penicillium malachiteum TaxID=1324776 RepID=A0AAD6HXQ6_9EURO|nr:hypothetical protein N7493_000800 [Penicillium malachiteum]